ncbi:hypothetical protein [Streptomyces sp. NBRC 109706]|uniref:hypothetical protein n=1 Tax=Streptomyces sp. NBRC 109706 TaxID=1550035 RepID=UPI000784ABCF|nr:hypothetical protein [Streptomyces sp. NBRC 109706]
MAKIYNPGTYMASFLIVWAERGPAGQDANHRVTRVTLDRPTSEAVIRKYVVDLALQDMKAERRRHHVTEFRITRA